jgi:predicted secreted Zn-dependent protease
MIVGPPSAKAPKVLKLKLLDTIEKNRRQGKRTKYTNFSIGGQADSPVQKRLSRNPSAIIAKSGKRMSGDKVGCCK